MKYCTVSPRLPLTHKEKQALGEIGKLYVLKVFFRLR